MIEFLTTMGLITLYIMWLLSPIIMMVLIDNYSDILGKLTCIVYVSGAIVIFYVLVNFIGIW